MAEKTKRHEESAPAKAPSNGNAGFFGSDVVTEEDAPQSSGYNFQRLHVQLTGLMLAVVLAGITLFGLSNFQRMEGAKHDTSKYQVVNATVRSAESGPNQTQKLNLIWGYDNNSKVSTLDTVSIGSSDKYVVDDIVSVMYLPSEFDPNTPSQDGQSFLSEQYEQMNVITYLPYIIGSGVVGVIVLLAGIALMAFMIKRVKRKETWG